jgi:hypothetical protein
MLLLLSFRDEPPFERRPGGLELAMAAASIVAFSFSASLPNEDGT